MSGSDEDANVDNVQLIGLGHAASPNTAPTAAGDAYAVNEDGTLIVPAPGVLNNDSDADSDALTAQLVTSTSSGSLAFNADGSFSYTPAANFFGSDSFTYRAFDGTDYSNMATVHDHGQSGERRASGGRSECRHQGELAARCDTLGQRRGTRSAQLLRRGEPHTWHAQRHRAGLGVHARQRLHGER